MSAIDRIAAAARGIVPPNHDEDPRAWRLNVFWSLLIIGGLLIGHLAAVHGYLEGMGISRTANASELALLDVRSKSILRAIYSPQIRAKVRQRCDADTPAGRERVNVELHRLLDAFELAAGEEFKPMPTCGEV